VILMYLELVSLNQLPSYGSDCDRATTVAMAGVAHKNSERALLVLEVVLPLSA
jgi:hypothetical protein